jgi:hypothetical protein
MSAPILAQAIAGQVFFAPFKPTAGSGCMAWFFLNERALNTD